MNVTDIFFNNWQFNWDVSNTIINTFLALVLVLITWWYASQAKKQTKRSKILEEVRDILTPMTDILTAELKAIQTKKIHWHRYTSGPCGFNRGLTRLFYSAQYGHVKYVFAEKGRGALKDVLTKSSDLSRMFSSHDSLIDELNELYVEFEKEIKIPEIEERLIKMAQEFNENKFGAHILNIVKPDIYFSEYIINIEDTIERIPDGVHPQIDFVEVNQEELLKFRDTPHIIEVSTQIRGKIIRLRELDETILKKVEKIREKYRKKYNFTDDEVEPSRHIKDGWN